MINIDLLLKEMEKKGVTEAELCRNLGMSQIAFSRKIKKGRLNTEEAEKIRRMLDIKDPGRIFFAQYLT